jgi:hypothetical protein
MMPASEVATKLPQTPNRSPCMSTGNQVATQEGTPRSAKHKRAVDACDRFVDLMEQSAIDVWRAREQAPMMPASDVATRLPLAPNRRFSMSTGNQVATDRGTPR